MVQPCAAPRQAVMKDWARHMTSHIEGGDQKEGKSSCAGQAPQQQLGHTCSHPRPRWVLPSSMPRNMCGCHLHGGSGSPSVVPGAGGGGSYGTRYIEIPNAIAPREGFQKGKKEWRRAMRWEAVLSRKPRKHIRRRGGLACDGKAGGAGPSTGHMERAPWGAGRTGAGVG